MRTDGVDELLRAYSAAVNTAQRSFDPADWRAAGVAFAALAGFWSQEAAMAMVAMGTPTLQQGADP